MDVLLDFTLTLLAMNVDLVKMAVNIVPVITIAKILNTVKLYNMSKVAALLKEL